MYQDLRESAVTVVIVETAEPVAADTIAADRRVAETAEPVAADIIAADSKAAEIEDKAADIIAADMETRDKAAEDLRVRHHLQGKEAVTNDITKKS